MQVATSPPATSRTFPTLSPQILPQMPGPLPRRSHRVPLPVSSSVSSAFPKALYRSASRFTRKRDFSADWFSRLQTFLYVQASEFARLPDRSYRCVTSRRAAETFTSGQNVRRYLRTHRICYPSDTGN
jgi:Iap family predicted aminopeptidase